MNDHRKDCTHALLLKKPAFLQDPFAQKEEYKDSWFDKFMVDYFAKQMSKQLGGELQSSSIVSLNVILLLGLRILLMALNSK